MLKMKLKPITAYDTEYGLPPQELFFVATVKASVRCVYVSGIKNRESYRLNCDI